MQVGVWPRGDVLFTTVREVVHWDRFAGEITGLRPFFFARSFPFIFARSEATKQSHEIASPNEQTRLAVTKKVRNDDLAVTLRARHCERSEAVSEPKKTRLLRQTKKARLAMTEERTKRRARRDPLFVVARGAAPKQPRSSGVPFETASEAKLRPGMTEEKG